MKRLFHGLALLLLAGLLAACGSPRQSVFPPTITIQQLRVEADGIWQLSLRIQNNSYTGMTFQWLEGTLQAAQGVPVRVHVKFDLAIPSFAGDVVQAEVLPTLAMSKALQAVATQGSASSLPYVLTGRVHGVPNLEDRPDTKNPRDFPFNSNAFLSPVPAVPNTFR